MKKPKPVTPKPPQPIWTILKGDTKEIKAMLKESKRLFEMSGNFMKNGWGHQSELTAQTARSLCHGATWLRCYVNGEFKKKK